MSTWTIARDSDGKTYATTVNENGSTTTVSRGSARWAEVEAWAAAQVPPVSLADDPPPAPPTPEQVLAAIRVMGKALLDSQSQVGALLRATLLELLDDRNTRIAANHNALLTWLSGQGTLTNRTQLTGFVIATPNITAVRDAIKGRLDAAQADA